MSFSHTYKTLRSGNTYKSHAHPEMYTHEEDTTVEAGLYANEQNNQTNGIFSPDMIEEKIKANLEPLCAQISPLRELMDRLIQGNSAREFMTASTRELRLQSESLFAEAPGASKFLPVAPLTTSRFSPDRLSFWSASINMNLHWIDQPCSKSMN